MSDSLQPHGLLPARLLWPWDFPGKTTGVGNHFLLQEIFLTQGLNPGPLHCRWPPALQAGSFLSHQCCVLSHFSHVQPFAIPWIAGSPRLLCPWNFRGKNTGVGCHALLQRIFLTQGSDPCLLCFLHWQVASLPLAPPGQAQATKE